MPKRYDKAIVAGDACTDVTLKISDILDNDRQLEMPYRVSLGGTSANTAVALSCLGVETGFLGTLGNDYSGKYIAKEMNALKIDTDLTIVKDELNTINVYAFIDDTGERHLWGFPRSEQAYADLDLSRVDLDKIRTASWFHSSGMTMLANGSIRETLPELFRIAYEAGVPTSFDFNTRVSSLEHLDPDAAQAILKTLPYVRYLTGSAKDEFVCFHPCEDWKDSVRYFANKDRAVIARMGSEGFMTIVNGEERYCPSYDVKVVNTTGAGDSFNAGFIAGILEGKDVYEAARLANAVSGYKISIGGQISRKAIDDFMTNTAYRSCDK